MPATYENLATTTLGSNQTTITFNSISSAYTDLIFVISTAGSTNNLQPYMRFNNDATSVYSVTELSGSGTAASSFRTSGRPEISLSPSVALSTTVGDGNYVIHIMNYSNTTTNKTALIRTNALNSGFPGTAAVVGLWRSTSAISRVDFAGGTFITGSTFTLYGIKAA